MPKRFSRFKFGGRVAERMSATLPPLSGVPTLETRGQFHKSPTKGKGKAALGPIRRKSKPESGAAPVLEAQRWAMPPRGGAGMRPCHDPVVVAAPTPRLCCCVGPGRSPLAAHPGPQRAQHPAPEHVPQAARLGECRRLCGAFHLHRSPPLLPSGGHRPLTCGPPELDPDGKAPGESPERLRLLHDRLGQAEQLSRKGARRRGGRRRRWSDGRCGRGPRWGGRAVRGGGGDV